VVARSKTWVCSRSLAGITASKAAEGMYVSLSLVGSVCCQVEVSAMGRSLVQRSLTDCGVFNLGCSKNLIEETLAH